KINFYYQTNSKNLASISAILPVAQNGAYGALTFGTRATDALGVTEKMRIDQTGNIGINTTTPQNLLNVIGDANVTGVVYRNNKALIDWSEATNGTLITWDKVINGTIWGQITNGTMASWANVVNGTVWAQVLNGTVMKQTTYDTNYSTLYLKTNPYSFYNSTSWNNPYSYYNSTSPPTETLWNANYTGFQQHITWANVTNGTLRLTNNHTFNGNVVMTNNLTVDTSDLFVNANTGYVGIGTASPLAQLTLSKSALAAEAIGSVNNPAVRIINLQSAAYNGKAELQFDVSAGGSQVGAAITGLYTDWTSEPDTGAALLFSTKHSGGGTLSERMRIDSSGNIGINTTTPQNLLNVLGNVNVTGVVYRNNNPLIDWGMAANGTLRLTNNHTFNGNVVMTNNLTVDTSDFFVNANTGNVGIGTTTPSQKMDVAGNINMSSGGILYSASQLGLYSTGANSITFNPNGVQEARMDSTGNVEFTNGTNLYTTNNGNISVDTNVLFVDLVNHKVGIGNNYPSAKLQVDGVIYAMNGTFTGTGTTPDTKTNAALVMPFGSSIYSYTTNNNVSLRNLIGADASGNIDIGQSATVLVPSINLKAGNAGNITFVPGGGEAMRIISNKNVGIGTTTPQSTLNVIGEVNATKFTSTSGMFDPAYTIDNITYATYAPAIVGLKEEVSGTINLDSQSTYLIDFTKLERGSDLWLFYQITDFGSKFENLQIILTPGFDGHVWYKKDPVKKTITIYGSQIDEEVSYRLTASRFDWQKLGGNLYNHNSSPLPSLTEKK
ncbi:MAG: hypothetical protein NTW17_00715, partial [Candidatus Pacearchaeota archaeon]|nr:hypothetical protein [Candidatus Pacearchaeota archaeon]